MPTASVSVCKGKGSLAHNNREFITPNVNVSRTEQNIVYKQEPLEVAYEKLFGEEVARYNAAQKRADRRIPDYMEHIRTSKNGEKLFYEVLVQIGNKFTNNVLTADGDAAKKMLDEYMKDFQRRNPNLYVFNAVLHLDEQTPHIHIDYIPIAREYKTGLQIRNSLDKALCQQGCKPVLVEVSGKEKKQKDFPNATQKWQAREKDALGEVMARHGWEREPEKGTHREALTINQYKAVADRIEQEVSVLPDQIERRAVPLSKDKVIVDARELDALERRAKLSIVMDKVEENIQTQTTEMYDEAAAYLASQKAMIEAERQRHREEMAAEKDRLKRREERVEHDAVAAMMAQRAVADTKKENVTLKAENATLTKELQATKKLVSALGIENNNLKNQIHQMRQEFVSQVKEVQSKAEAAVARVIEAVKAVCKAVGVLMYGDRYRVEGLTPEQERLINAIENYGAKVARAEGFDTVAEDIDRHVGISPAISEEIKALEPKVQKKDRGGMER